jgi:hypothetical protein
MPALYSPHPKQIEAHLDDHKKKLLFWGRQVGKTYYSINDNIIRAIRKQGTYFMIFRTYKQAHEVVWRELLSQIPAELLKKCKTNENDLTIEFPYLKGPMALPGIGWVAVKHNPDKPRSIIQLLGSDQSESHRGRHCDWQTFDEYAFQNPDNLRSVYNPMLSTTNGGQTFMSTPNGYNHWFDMVELGREDEEWYYSEATWRDNPLVSKDFIASEKKSAERDGEMSKFEAEYELQFRTVEGPVYEHFDRKVHVIKPDEIPKEGSLYVGIDFGYENPTAAVFVLIDYDDNWYIFDELYRKRTEIRDIIPMVRDKIGDQRLILMVGDNQASEAIAQMQNHFPIVPISKKKDSIIEGIRLINTKLHPRAQLTGPPRPKLFVTSNCKNFIYEMDQYHYPEKKQGRNSNEQPVKDNDHLMDAVRYLALYFKYNQGAEIDSHINTKVKFNEMGLL